MNKHLSVSMTKTETWLGWLLMAAQLLVLPVVLFFCNQLLPKPLTLAELNFAVYLLNFLLTLAVFHRFLWQNLKISLQAPIRTLRSAFLGFTMYYLSSLLIGLFIQTVYPGFSNTNDNTIFYLVQENYILIALATVFLVPVAEESIYRGLIFRSLQEKNPILGYVVSALAFALIHIVGYIGTEKPVVLLLCLIQYLPAGFALAWAYSRADSIWAPILIHIAINQIGISSMR